MAAAVAAPVAGPDAFDMLSIGKPAASAPALASTFVDAGPTVPEDKDEGERDDVDIDENELLAASGIKLAPPLEDENDDDP